MGLATHHVHVEEPPTSGRFHLADVPTEWEAFWAFWCDQVQPAVRKATGRDDIWGIGLPCRPRSVDTENWIWQFIHAYEANYVTRDGRLVIDDPEVRRRLIKAVDSYTAIYRKGCTPPDSVDWTTSGNNNNALPGAGRHDDAEPDALDRQRAQARAAEDYYKNTATIDWPAGADGQPLVIETGFWRPRSSRSAGTPGREGVRALPGRRGLARALPQLLRRAHAAADAEAARRSRSGWTRATRTACARRSSS